MRNVLILGVIVSLMAGVCSQSSANNMQPMQIADATPANAQALIDEALKKQIGNDFAGAAAIYKKAIELAPNNAKAHSDLAACLQQTDEFAAAREEYQKGYNLDKKNERENLYYMAVLDEHLNRGPVALQEYQTYLKDSPTGAYVSEAQTRVRELMVNTNKTAHLVTRAAQEKAAADQAKAAAASQSYNEALQLQGAGKFEEAIAKYLEALKNSNDASIWFGLGTAYQNKQEWDKAIEAYDKTIAANPKDPNNAKALIKQCKAGKAAPLFDSAVKKQTTADDKGQYDIAGAILDYEKAVAINDDGTTRMNLGTAYQANNNIAKAIENYKRALALDKNLFDCYYYLGTAQEGNKAPALALVEYKKYLQFAPTGPNANEAKERIKILTPPAGAAK